MRPVCLLLLTFAGATAGTTERRASAEDVFQLVTTALATYYNDQEVAATLEDTVVTERLTDDLVQALRSRGAGPLTLGALDGLRERSAASPPPARTVVDFTLPPVSEWHDIFHRMNLFAVGYVRSLPDFVCTATTQFYESGRRSDSSPKKSGKRAGWRLRQTVSEEVRFADGADSYQTKLVDNKPDSRPMAAIRTAYTRGDFGAVLTMTFDPQSQTQFKWDHWEILHGTRVAVFSYAVEQEHSLYEVCCTSAGTLVINGISRPQITRWVSAYRGFIYTVPDSGVILRFTLENVRIPPTSDLSEARHLFEYSGITLNGEQHWLTSRAIHYNRIGGFRWQSVVEFSKYHKFGADSSITFPAEQK